MFEQFITGEQYSNTQTRPYFFNYNFNKNTICNLNNNYRGLFRNGILYVRYQTNRIHIVEQESNFEFNQDYTKEGEYYFYILANNHQIKFNVKDQEDEISIAPNKFRTITVRIKKVDGTKTIKIEISDESDVILLQTKNLF